ncbi:MAG TPA: FtsX-like permease family protein [Clostridiaceae bacterium]|nr:FtsX-like permease family protein [Clostridiaceae bacterium]
MIFRNSVKSILRTPIKTVSFAFLIAAVTAFLYLGINTWVASVSMLRDCEENYTTIVTIEYLEDYGSKMGSKSESMLADIAAIDFDAIASNENVILWQPSDVGMGSAANVIYNDYKSDYSDSCVFIVTGIRQFSSDSQYYCKLVESLYSIRDYEPGRTVFIENNFEEEFGFVPDPDAVYVILAQNSRTTANGLSVEITPFYSWIAQEAGVDCTKIEKIQKIDSAEALHAEEDNIYLKIAKFYEAMNNSLMICRAREIDDIEEFNQGYLKPVSGRLFTREEADSGAKVCVISQSLANTHNLNVGDTLTIRLSDDENATMYAWGDKMSRQEDLTIVGIVNHHTDYHRNVYTTPVTDSARPVRFLYDLGQATIRNGTAEEFLSAIKPLLPERTFIAVYDQGYQATADALKVIRNAAISLSVIAFAVTITVLSFFAYMFTDKQREAIEIMRCFGAKKNETRLYLIIGASLTSLVAVAAGILTGTMCAEEVIKYAYEFVSELQVVDMRYSDGFRGIVKEFNPVMTMSAVFALIVGVAVQLIAVSLCLYYAEKTINGKLISARARVRVRKPPKKSSVALSGALRHAVLYIRRGGIRSLLVPSLCAAAMVFVSLLQSTLTSYYAAKESLYESTDLTGYCAQMNGKFSDRLVINNTHAIKLTSMEHISDIKYTYTLNYGYLGIVRHADGSEGQVDPMPMPGDPYELEIMNDTLAAQPNIIFTDEARSAPEFLFADFHADFMPGWDEARFSSREWEILPCIVSSQFMNDKGIKPGDTIRVYVKDYFIGFLNFISMDMMVVGSFSRVANQNNIYCPLPLGALDPERSTLNDLPKKYHYITTGRYLKAATNYPMATSFSLDMFTKQQILDIILDNKYVSSLTFKIRDPRVLGEVKDMLEREGFSGPTLANDIRVCVVIEDAQYNETLSSIEQRSKYLEMLYPVLIVLVCILGLITGFLAIHSRREDVALMRGMGTQKWRIFATLFIEQLMLLFFGVLAAAVIFSTMGNMAQLASPAVYAFFVCYALSVALSIMMQNAKKAFSILSEKE